MTTFQETEYFLLLEQPNFLFSSKHRTSDISGPIARVDKRGGAGRSGAERSDGDPDD